MYKHIFSFPTLFLFLILTQPFQGLHAQQPEQDCINAIPVCSLMITQTNSYIGDGFLPDEINSMISCLDSGEENNVWYEVSIVSSGLLSFTLSPNFFLDDYDWAVYDLSNSSCADIATNSRIEISCNYSATSGATGPNLPGGSNSNNAGGPNRNAPIPVLAGGTYVINVSNFSGTSSGYMLDFSASSAILGSSSVPALSSISRIGNTDTLLLSFDNEISCSSLSESDLEILANTNLQTIDSIWSPNCLLPAQTSQDFRVILSNPLPPHTQLTVNLIDTVFNDCGNFSTAGSIQNNIFPVFQVSSSANPICEGDSIVLSTTLPDSGYSFLWLPSQDTSTNITVAPLSSQDYYVQVTELSSNLTESDTLRVEVNQIPRISLGNDFLFCADSILLAVPAGIWASYQWEDGSTDSVRTISAAGNYSLEVLDQMGCIGRDSLFIDKDTLPISSFGWMTDTLSVSFLDSSSRADSVLWDLGDGNFSYDNNPTHTYDSVGTYTVSLITSNRCGADTLMREVEVKGWPSSISEKIFDQFLKIYPNPGSHQINLQFLHSSFQGQTLQVYDMQGRLLRDYKKIQGMSLNIDRGRLTSGIYFIRIGNLSRKIWFE